MPTVIVSSSLEEMFGSSYELYRSVFIPVVALVNLRCLVTGHTHTHTQTSHDPTYFTFSGLHIRLNRAAMAGNWCCVSSRRAPLARTIYTRKKGNLKQLNSVFQQKYHRVMMLRNVENWSAWWRCVSMKPKQCELYRFEFDCPAINSNRKNDSLYFSLDAYLSLLLCLNIIFFSFSFIITIIMCFTIG